MLCSFYIGDFTNIFAWLFLHKEDEKLFWLMTFGTWQINFANFTVHIGQISSMQNVGEIEWQIFCHMLCARNFCLGAQRLVKLKSTFS